MKSEKFSPGHPWCSAARRVEFDADACQLPPDRGDRPGVTTFSAQNRERSV